MQKENYNIKLTELETKLKEVYTLGYGNTIHLTINGEEYKLIDNTEIQKTQYDILSQFISKGIIGMDNIKVKTKDFYLFNAMLNNNLIGFKPDNGYAYDSQYFLTQKGLNYYKELKAMFEEVKQ